MKNIRPAVCCALIGMLWSQETRLNAASLSITSVGEAYSTDTIEIRGLSAGLFNSQSWTSNSLHWMPDVRSPLLQPRPGPYRNIYAPSVVARAGYWDVFYGAWDGVATPNDRIYHTTTTDFLQFGERSTVVEHGEFQHVCNVSAVASGDRGFDLLCTGYPDSHGLNKPVLFNSPDGLHWNGSPAPHTATRSEIVSLSGYSDYARADINGMNVLFRDPSGWHMFFADFNRMGTIWRASGADPAHFTVDAPALQFRAAPNDLKRFANENGSATWLIGLHMNIGKTWFATSSDGLHFRAPEEMFAPTGYADRYIVSVGFVTDSAAATTSGNTSLLGVLYGAGAKPTLDQNRIFARWLQKRVRIDANGKFLESSQAYGPDRQLFECATSSQITGTLQLLAEDGTTQISATTATLLRGKAYHIELPERRKFSGSLSTVY